MQRYGRRGWEEPLPREEVMTRVAPWAFAALYLIVAAVAAWLGVVTLNPPPEGPQQYIPEVNTAMMATAVFAFVCAALFLAAVGLAVRLIRKKDPLALSVGLQAAFAAALAMV